MQKIVLAVLTLIAVSTASRILTKDVPQEKFFFGAPLWIPLPCIPTIKPVVGTPNVAACTTTATIVACTCGSSTCRNGETCTVATSTCAVVNPACGPGVTQTPCSCGADTCTAGETCTVTTGTCA